MKGFAAGIVKLDKALYVLAGAVLVIMVLVTLVDVVLRNFGHPITGSMEIIQYGGLMVFAFSIPYATFLKAHVLVDLVIEKLGAKAQKGMAVATRLMGLLFFLFVTYQFYLYGIDVKKTGELSAAFKIPYYPLVFAVCLAFLFQSLTILIDLVGVIRGDAEEVAE